jgi:8-oxo-dGTP pyrophosphatase MutT (NUDIX family)
VSNYPQKIGPWTCLDSTPVYDNPWLSVRHENVITPGGTQGIYGVVHFKSRAIAIVPIDNENHTWLVKQFRYTLNEYSWEVPMGGAPLDEAPLLGAQRELKEETGLSATHWQQIMKLHTSNSVTDEEAIVFVARDLTEGEQALEPSEDIEVMRLPFADALAMVKRGEITDALSVAALLMIAAQT